MKMYISPLVNIAVDFILYTLQLKFNSTILEFNITIHVY